ncbi:MAG: bifunctional oligoribonuclease/PAP phosphatase NrnA [Vicinamibacterales bacterium]
MATKTETAADREIVGRIRLEIERRQRFLITSHVRPDGDSIGSQMAMAYALEALGKEVRVVNRDPAPAGLKLFPGVSRIEIGDRVEGPFDAAIVMECGDLDRTGIAGIDRYYIINIDHHPGNSRYGALNWFDGTAAACGEMVYAVIKALGVSVSLEIATHIYVAILTDTGSFHYSTISPRTFDICREALEAGVDPVAIARTVFDSNNVGRLRLFGAVLNSIEIDPSGRLAVIHVDREMARSSGGTYDDTEGLINLPLTVPEIQAVVFFKEWEDGTYRVSMRSKGDIDVCRVAREFGGGGHKNASGCTVRAPYEEARRLVIPRVIRAIDEPNPNEGCAGVEAVPEWPRLA